MKYLLKAHIKIIHLKGLFRRSYFKLLGMQIGKNSKVGNINCHWPNRVTIGRDSEIEDDVTFKITHPFSVDNKIVLGDRVFIGAKCSFNCNTTIEVGSDSMIASNTTLVDTGHEININEKINKQPLIVANIKIGEDVWIGTHCKILKGVNIGDGAVIGAGSLVNKSVPPYQIWAGTPARFIRNR